MATNRVERVRDALLSSVVPLFIVAFLIRAGMLVYGLWQDATMAVKYTDIDYLVFSEASEFVFLGNSPYDRSTYRYTPLLAWIMLPNIFFHPSFGKWLFILSDVLIGYFIKRILEKIIPKGPNGTVAWPKLNRTVLIHFLTAVWLFNPIAMNVSSRGNAESIISLMVVMSVDLLLSEQYLLSALLYGLSVHFKVYPLIFAPSLFMFIEHDSKNGWRIPFTPHILKITKNRVLFTLCSAGTFLFLTWIMYYIYGFEFLWETYLYHVVRKDHRHNFSAYFYQIYLSTADSNNATGAIIGFLAFLPQFVLLLAIAFVYHKDLGFCIFLQTLTFVIFNKVCTVQYFIWYFSLLPFALVRTVLSLPKAILMGTLWFVSQAIWLYFGYHLEFLGENTFLQLWIASVGFFFVNIWILIEFIRCHIAVSATSTVSDEKKRK